jgi:hypothetical protein
MRWNIVDGESGHEFETGEYDFAFEAVAEELLPDVLLDVCALALSREARRYRGERYGHAAIDKTRAPEKLGYIKGQLIGQRPPQRRV